MLDAIKQLLDSNVINEDTHTEMIVTLLMKIPILKLWRHGNQN